MKAHLLFRTRDFGWKPALQTAASREAARTGRQYRGENFDPRSGLPWNDEALTTDLGLNTLFEAMAQGDDRVFEVARKVILGGVTGDLETIRYRQAILQDCLRHPAVVRELYAVAVEAMETQRRHYLGSFLVRYPDAVLRYSIELMAALLELLKKLRKVADSSAERFVSDGWADFFATLKRELDDAYLAGAQHHLEQLKFRHGVLLSAALGTANKGSDYVLRRFPERRRGWLDLWWDLVDALIGVLTRRGETCPRWLRPDNSPVYSFSLHPRDEAGARALADLRNRGISLVADALAQSVDHVRDFFGMLQAELGFYVGCVNLHQQLVRKGAPVCMPAPAAAEERRLSFHGLYDVCLALKLEQRVVGNDADGDGQDLVIVTGANQGGKSTFLRSVGLAQLMMQSGMFAPAEAFSANICAGLFTHYKREEDPGMKSGKLDEELSRMSDIVDHVSAHSLVLFNESFAATNEREGSELGRHIMTALLYKKVRIVCVTHLYELARGFYDKNSGDTLFLRAERARNFKLLDGEPLPTSYGEDLYNIVFADNRERLSADRAQWAAS
jgi:DNA mismatch repair ATPase MutS